MSDPVNFIQNIDPRFLTMLEKPTVRVGLQNTFTHVLEPTRLPSESDSEIVFDIPSTGGAYLDLRNTELYLKGRLKRADNTDLESGEKVVLTNNALYSLFDSVTIYVGQNQTEIHSTNYALKSFMMQLMNNDVKTPSMTTQGMLVEYTSTLFDNDYEMGEARKIWTLNSRSVEFMGAAFISFFNTQGYLIPGCPIRVKFRKNRDSYYVVADPEFKDIEYNFIIEKMALYVPALRVNPELSPLLESQIDVAPARYFFDSLELKQWPVPQGTLTRNFKKVFEGLLPSKILIGLYGQANFSGDRTTSPLITEATDLRQITLYLNGLAVREHRPKFDEGLYMETYRKFLDWMNGSRSRYFVDYESFSGGYQYFCFDMLENCPESNPCEVNSGAGVIDVQGQRGYMDIQLDFKTAVDKDCVMAVFYISPDAVDITKSRTASYIHSVL